jgi:sensor histidine kinase YesM
MYFRTPKEKHIFWGATLGFWSLIAILNTSQNILSWLYEQGSVEWPRVLAWSLPGWLIWALLTPLVFLLARRFQFERHRWKRIALTHSVLSLLCASAHLVLETIIIDLVVRAVGERFLTWAQFRQLLVYGFHISILVYWALVGVATAFSYYRQFQERQIRTAQLEAKASQLHAKLSETKLNALKAQIHPHFLFNAHQAIQTLMFKNETRKARRMLTQLGDLLRMVLEMPNVQEVTLQRELELINLYLEIQRVRFQDRLRVIKTVAPETLKAAIPSLILQPLVENSIKHGIDKSSKAGLLEIHVSRMNGRLLITISDDGPGIPTEACRDSTNTKGLAITDARLQHMYGEGYSFTLENAPDVGAVVRLEIPFRELSGDVA